YLLSLRTRTSRMAPVVAQVATPNGRHGSHSMRIDRRRSFVSRSTIFSLSIHASICFDVTRIRMRYHCSRLNSIDLFVSFSEASMPLMLDRPTPLPPQPPTAKEENDLPTGKVVVQKKSLPATRRASSVTS